MSFTIKPATRQGIKPLIVCYSESGCGKTYSALLLARGIAGPKGKIVMADSESGRGSLYADIAEIGGYQTFDLASPFTPARYVEAVDAIEESGADVGIIDSGSHEWEGPSGVLDMAAEIEQKSGRAGLHCWRAPKFEHALFVQRLLRIKIPLIVCLRAKYKSRQTKDDKGKTVIVKDQATSPIQSEEFIFEATCHFEILPNHSIIVTKEGHRDLRACLPADKTSMIEIKHGEALARWCNAPTGPGVPQAPSAASTAGLADAGTRQRMIAKFAGFEQQALGYAIDQGWLMPNETLDEWPLKHVPTTLKALTSLIQAIEGWAGK